MLKIGQEVPDFKFDVYHNNEFKQMKLSDTRGKWTVLLFYPADFTFVCPTELEEAAHYYEEFKNTLFATDALKRAIDDIYKYPLKESAKDTIGRQLKAGVTVGVLIDLVSALREEDKLCIITEEDNKYREPQIICSLGIKNEEE